jgi:hypothetical protein
MRVCASGCAQRDEAQLLSCGVVSSHADRRNGVRLLGRRGRPGYGTLMLHAVTPGGRGLPLAPRQEDANPALPAQGACMSAWQRNVDRNTKKW